MTRSGSRSRSSVSRSLSDVGPSRMQSGTSGSRRYCLPHCTTLDDRDCEFPKACIPIAWWNPETPVNGAPALQEAMLCTSNFKSTCSGWLVSQPRSNAPAMRGSVRSSRSRSPLARQVQSPSRSRNASYSKKGASGTQGGASSGKALIRNQSPHGEASSKRQPRKVLVQKHFFQAPTLPAGSPSLSPGPQAYEPRPAAAFHTLEDLARSALQEAGRAWAVASAEDSLSAQQAQRPQPSPHPSAAPDVPASSSDEPLSEASLGPDLQHASALKAGSSSKGTSCGPTEGGPVLPGMGRSLLGQRYHVEEKPWLREYFEVLSSLETGAAQARFTAKQSQANGSEEVRVTQQEDSSIPRGSMLVGGQHVSAELNDWGLVSPLSCEAWVRQPSQSGDVSLKDPHRQVGLPHILAYILHAYLRHFE